MRWDCSCHISPPCHYCTDPNNPINQQEEEDVTTPFHPDQHQFVVEGRDKCGQKAPPTGRVYFKRGRTGSGVIYLYANRAYAETNERSDGNMAFGWIGVPIATRIFLTHKFGYCDWFNDGINHPSIRDGHVVFAPGAPMTDGSGSGTLQGSHEHHPYFGRDFTAMYGHNWETGFALDQINLEELRDGYAWRLKQWRDKNKSQALKTAYTPPITTTETSKEETMTSKTSTVIARAQNVGSRLIASNKQAAASAGYLEAGHIANKQLAKLAGKKLPMLVRGYADTEFGRLVIANIAQQLAAELRPDNAQLASLTAAMTTAAYVELVRTVNLDGIIDELLDSKDMKLALSKLGQADAEE